MTKYFTNNFSIINLYKKPSIKSEVVTQLIYGESFSVSKSTKKWLKIKLKKIVIKDSFKIEPSSNLQNLLIKYMY